MANIIIVNIKLKLNYPFAKISSMKYLENMYLKGIN